MENNKWIDISMPLTNEIASWPGDELFKFSLNVTKEQSDSVNIGFIQTSVHTGTHVDSPFHFIDNGETIDMIPLEVFIGTVLIIDVTGHNLIDASLLNNHDLNGVKRIIFKTDNNRNEKEFPENYTVFDKNVGPYLKNKGVRLIGTDAPSVDHVTSKTLLAHHSFAQNDIYIIENLLLNSIRPGLYEMIALPLNLVGADASPLRVAIKKVQ